MTLPNIDYFIYREKVIPDQICDYIRNELDKINWSKHQWGPINYNIDENTSKILSSEKENQLLSKEPDVCYWNPLDSILKTFVSGTAKRYEEKYSDRSHDNTSQFIFSLSEIRFNRYHTGQKMERHFDHIKSLFDGNNKGIPAVSFVGFLNDDYEGGEFVFWNEYEIKPKRGEVLCFPSNFMYQHHVNPVISGVRDTFVFWGW